MGKGNCCVHGRCEGLYFIDKDDFYVYRFNDPYAEESEIRLQRDLSGAELTGGDWFCDEEGTMCEEEDVLECFMESFTEMFPDFERTESDLWLDDSNMVILESSLFYIAVEDNEWSLAVKLLQKEAPYDDDDGDDLADQQESRYQDYLAGMKTALLNRLPSIGIYTGPWTSGIIRRGDE